MKIYTYKIYGGRDIQYGTMQYIFSQMINMIQHDIWSDDLNPKWFEYTGYTRIDDGIVQYIISAMMLPRYKKLMVFL